MKLCFMFLALMTLTACSFEVGDFGEKRQSWYDKNTVDCNKTPNKCVNGYPW
ncbi:MAG: hypothetical protein IKA03_00595 [Alphaproteobacteria bacterium]|nr:hypothetical protein [Alphaproteobacteria bacterium]